MVAETLPPELTESDGGFSGGYSLADMDGLLMAAMKGLDVQVRQLARENESLRQEVQELRSQNARFRERVEAIEALLQRTGLIQNALGWQTR